MQKKNKNVGVGLDQPAKNNKGITLIALIITIIVMLILVAVAVRIAINSGLFGHAGNATKQWADTEKQEQELEGEVDRLIDKYTGTKEHNWKRTGDNINCEHCGLSFVIGDYVDYEPDATSKTVTVTKEEVGTIIIGFEIPNIERVEDQTFTQDTETYWQVLGVEDSDGDGTNETLLIKMAFGTEDTLYLGGAEAYNNGPDIMNRIAKELYSSSKYGEARSINITDVNNTLQYTPGGGFYYDSEQEELDGFNTQMKDLPTWNTVKSNGTYTPDGTNTETKLGSYKVDGYHYTLGSSIKGFLSSLPDLSATTLSNPATGATTNITSNTRDIVFTTPDGDAACYWLACRGVQVGDGYAIFGPCEVAGGFVESCNGTFSSIGGYVGYAGLPVCPVVSLKSEIPAKITPVFEIPAP